MLENPLPYVALSDVYIQTSDVESYGLSIQEALVLGKPVVSTKTIGGEMLLKDRTGCILAEHDGKSVADGMISCLNGTSDIKNDLFYSKDAQIKTLWDNLIKQDF